MTSAGAATTAKAFSITRSISAMIPAATAASILEAAAGMAAVETETTEP